MSKLNTTTYNNVAANTVDDAVLDASKILAWRQNVKTVVDGNDDLRLAHLSETASDDVHGLGFKGLALDRNGSAQSIPNNIATHVSYQTVEVNTDSMFNVSDLSKVVVPAGVSKMRITCNTWFADNATGFRIMELRKNASFFNGAIYVKQRGSSAMNGDSGVLDVSPGDYFQVRVLQDSGGALDVVAGSYTWIKAEVVE